MSGLVQPLPSGWSEHAIALSGGGWGTALAAAGSVRAFSTYVPAAQSANVQSAAGLVLFLHAQGESGAAWCAAAGVAPLADARGFVAVCPQAAGESSCWRAFGGGGGCGGSVALGDDAGESRTDVVFLDALLEWVALRVPRPHLVTHIVGCGNGGSMAYRMACEGAAALDGLVILEQPWYDPAVRWGLLGAGEARCPRARHLPVWNGAGGSRDLRADGITLLESQWVVHSREVRRCAGAVRRGVARAATSSRSARAPSAGTRTCPAGNALRSPPPRSTERSIGIADCPRGSRRPRWRQSRRRRRTRAPRRSCTRTSSSTAQCSTSAA